MEIGIRSGRVDRKRSWQLFSLPPTYMTHTSKSRTSAHFVWFLPSPVRLGRFPDRSLLSLDLRRTAILLPPLLECWDTGLLALLAMRLTFLSPSGSSVQPSLGVWPDSSFLLLELPMGVYTQITFLGDHRLWRAGAEDRGLTEGLSPFLSLFSSRILFVPAP